MIYKFQKKLILDYYKSLSVHSAVHFKHILKTLEVIMKLHVKSST